MLVPIFIQFSFYWHDKHHCPKQLWEDGVISSYNWESSYGSKSGKSHKVRTEAETMGQPYLLSFSSWFMQLSILYISKPTDNKRHYIRRGQCVHTSTIHQEKYLTKKLTVFSFEFTSFCMTPTCVSLTNTTNKQTTTKHWKYTRQVQERLNWRTMWSSVFKMEKEKEGSWKLQRVLNIMNVKWLLVTNINQRMLLYQELPWNPLRLTERSNHLFPPGWRNKNCIRIITQTQFQRETLSHLKEKIPLKYFIHSDKIPIGGQTPNFQLCPYKY